MFAALLSELFKQLIWTFKRTVRDLIFSIFARVFVLECVDGWVE